MPRIYPAQTAFARGELAPRMHSRFDTEHYQFGLARAKNVIVHPAGPVVKRTGTQFMGALRDPTVKGRLMPFVFSVEQAYLLIFTNTIIRYLADAAAVTTGSVAITGITSANPAVVTATAHGRSNGDRILITDVTDMVQVNNREFTVANKTANTLELSGVNATGYDAYGGGGTLALIVETVSPYPTADLFGIDYAQSADVLGLVHNSHQPRELTRTSDIAWSISTIDFLDGPYFKEPVLSHASLSFSNTGGLTPGPHAAGTASAAPISAGVAANAFDQVDNTSVNLTFGADAWVEYDFNAAESYVAVGYTLRIRESGNRNGLYKWRFEGWDGTNWIALDNQIKAEGWSVREKMFYPINNAISFLKYRVFIEGGSTDFDASNSMSVSEISITEKAGDQPLSVCTASSTIGINGDAGFNSGDVGRAIRLRGRDGLWRWFKITAFTSTTSVSGNIYGPALEDEGESISRWQLGSFFAGNWPGHISFYSGRRAFARTPEEPSTLWLTKVGDFYDFGMSSPLRDDDGINLTITSGEVNAIQWMSEGTDLLIGTTNGMRIIKSGNTDPFSATNVAQRQHTVIGAGAVLPVRVGNSVIFADFHRKALREFIYSFDIDAYISPELTTLSHHFFDGQVTQIAYQQTPMSVVWVVTDDGRLIAITLVREEKVVGICEMVTDGTFISVAVIPGTTQDDVYVIVKRTIGGNKYYVEKLFPVMDDDANHLAGQFLDSALIYSGAAVGTTGGYWHLEGKTVTAFVSTGGWQGTAYEGLTVSNGKVTLPGGATATDWLVGLPYEARIRSLGYKQGQDGTLHGRRTQVSHARIDLYRSASVLASYPDSTAGNLVAASTSLQSGVFGVTLDNSERDNGQFDIWSDGPFPMEVRTIVLEFDGEP